LQCSQNPLAVFKGPTSKGREGQAEERGREGKVKEREGERRWRKRFGPPKNLEVGPLCSIAKHFRYTFHCGP